MKTDEELQSDVKLELVWEPSLDEGHIQLYVKDGAVTLDGHVPTYAQKRAAVRAVERVSGVKAVADDLKVQLASSHVRDDTDIAESLVHIMKWNVHLPKDLKVEVARGIVTLRGTVAWEFQRKEAVRVIRGVIGVQGVDNLIELKPHAGDPQAVKTRIADALRRQASFEARQIDVVVHDSTAVLSGQVHSLAEERSATNAAYAAPGISRVESHLTVESM